VRIGKPTKKAGKRNTESGAGKRKETTTGGRKQNSKREKKEQKDRVGDRQAETRKNKRNRRGEKAETRQKKKKGVDSLWARQTSMDDKQITRHKGGGEQNRRAQKVERTSGGKLKQSVGGRQGDKDAEKQEKDSRARPTCTVVVEGR